MKLSNYINGIDHLGIIVPDIDFAVEYYICNFGFSLIHKKLVIDPIDGAINAAFVRLQDMVLELFTPMSIKNEIYSRKDGILDHFAIDCGNVEKACSCLLGKGLKFHSSTPDGIVDYVNLGCRGVKGVNFIGSFGEVVEVCATGAKDYKGVDVLAGWSHLAIKVHDLSKSIEFYNKLGFKKCGDGYLDTDEGRLYIAFLVCHWFMLEIIQVCGLLVDDLDKRSAGHIDHFALNTSDIKNAFYCAKSEGFKLLNPVIKELNLFARGVSYFMLEGPDGEIIEVAQKNI